MYLASSCPFIFWSCNLSVGSLASSNLVLTKEKILNYFIIKKILKKKLSESDVNLLLKKKI